VAGTRGRTTLGMTSNRPCPALHLSAFIDSLVAGIGIDHCLLAMQEISRGGEVMHIGSRGFH